MQKIIDLHNKRLRSLSLNLNSKEIHAADIFFQHILGNENHFRILERHNIDTIMLCCVFVAFRLTAKKVSWSDIIASYEMEPYYDSNVSLTNIDRFKNCC